MKSVGRDEAAVEVTAFFFEYIFNHLYPGFTQHRDAASADLFEWIAHADNGSPESFFYQELATWRGFAVMRAGFKRDVYG